MNIIVSHVKHTSDLHRAGYAVMRIDRSSPYGNPFAMRDEQDRARVIDAYRAYIASKPALVARLRAEITQAGAGKRGVALVCWCAPKACHGDVLKELVNA